MKRRRSEQGFGIIEVLFSMAILGILSLALVESTAFSFRVSKKMYRDSLATKLAASKLEEYSLYDPSSYDESDSGQEIVMAAPNVNLMVDTTIVVNADLSRTVSVQVTPPSGVLGGTSSMQTTFFLRGNL